MIADAATLFHMKLPAFSSQTQSEISSRFPRFLPYANPLDLAGTMDLAGLMEAASEAMKDPNMDVILLGLEPTAIQLEDPAEMAKKLADRFGPGKTEKPFLVVEFGGKQEFDRTLRMALKERGIAIYSGPEEALRGLEKLMNYAEFLESQEAVDEVSPFPQCSLDVRVGGLPRGEVAVPESAEIGAKSADGGGGLRGAVSLRNPNPRVHRRDERRGGGGLRGKAVFAGRSECGG